jgi:hypothetical protein
MTFHRTTGDKRGMGAGQMICFNRRLQKVFHEMAFGAPIVGEGRD